jgi:hypothetical protein
MTTWPGVSMRRVCRVLKFSRARLRARAVIAAAPPRFDEVLAERIQRLIERHPTFGYRRLWAMLRFVEGIRVNRKAVYRLRLLKGLCEVHGEKALTLPRSSGGGSPSQGLRIMPRITRLAPSSGVRRPRGPASRDAGAVRSAAMSAGRWA